MLVLARLENQKILITVGEQKIEITVLEINRGKVRLGFQADSSISIHREEVYLDMLRRKSNDQSAAS